MRRQTINKFKKKALILNCCDIGLDREGDLNELLGDILYITVGATQVELLRNCHNLIQQKVRGAIHDANQLDDALSYITTEVLKSYKFRWKYNGGNDWVHVVKSVINRRLIDFKAKQYRYSRMLHNTGLFVSDSEYLDYYNEQECDDSAEKMYRHDQAQFVTKLINDNRSKFLPIELEYVDAIYFLFDEGYDPMVEHNVYISMGYEKGNQDHKREFNRIKSRTQKKIKYLIKGISDEDCTTF